MNSLRLTLMAAVTAVLFACGGQEVMIDGGDDVAGGGEADLSTSTNGKFETFTGIDGKHYFHLLAGNGEKVLASEGYSTAAAAEAGIAAVKANGVDARRFLQREAVDGSSYFVVIAGNGEIIGTSEMYTTASNATRGAEVTRQVVANTTQKFPALLGSAKFETFRGLDSKYYFHLRAGNGQIILQSQGYTSSTSAKTGIASVQTNGATTAKYEIRAAADGKSYFVLKAANGQVIGFSETYASKSNAQRGLTTCANIVSGGDAR